MKKQNMIKREIKKINIKRNKNKVLNIKDIEIVLDLNKSVEEDILGHHKVVQTDCFKFLL